MDKKQTILWTILFSLLLFSMSTYGATLTLNLPKASASLTGATNILNVSIALNTADNNVTNLTWYYRASTSVAWIVLGNNATNNAGDTTNRTWYVRVWDVSGLSDGLTYQINVTAKNNTIEGGATSTVIGDVVVSNINIDNNNPTANLLGVPGSAKRKGDIDYRCDSSTDAVDSSLTFDVNLTDPNGANVSKTSSIGTFTDLDLEIGGNYILSCRVTDNVNKTSIASANIWVSSDGVREKQITQSEVQKTTLTSPLFIIIIGISVIVIIIIVVLFIVLSSKKKR